MSPDALRVAIVDDEPLAREALERALRPIDGVQVVGTAADGPTAVELVRTERPDAVFLDVRMPGMDGFEVLEALEAAERPKVVFVTAHDDHAVRAFDVHAVDYLVKPFDDTRLAEAVERLRVRPEAGERPSELVERIEALLEEGSDPDLARTPPAGGWHTRIQVRRDDRIRFVDVAHLRYVETDGNHLVLHLDEGTARIRHTLKDLLAVLDPKRFVRIHRSTAVNLDFVREVQPWFSGDYVALMDGGEELRVSRHYRDRLLRSTF